MNAISAPPEPAPARTAPLPTFLRIAEAVGRDIASGRLADGDRLPPERVMAAQHGVAVGTLRKALAELASRGQLARRQGSGNYVRAAGAPQAIYALFRLELAEGGGGLPTAQVLSTALAPKDAALPRFGHGPLAHRIRRLRSLSGRPASVEEIWLCASVAPTLDKAALSESLYLHYRQRFGLVIAAAEDRIGQAPLPRWTPPGFGHPPGTALPVIERASKAADGRVVEISRTWFDPAVARYVARLS